jgi:hypothetical protein
MAIQQQRSAFACSLCHIVSFIKDDDTIFNDLLVVGEEVSIEEVVVRHNEQIGKLLCLNGVEIRAEFLLQTILLHFINV